MKRIIALLLILCLSLTLSGCMTDNNQSEEKYNAFAQNDNVMPSTDEINGCLAYYPFCHYESIFLGIDYHSYILIVQYDKGQYDVEKTRVRIHYYYEGDVLQDHVKEHDLFPVFSVGDYEFRLLDVDQYQCNFPESYYIGTNDSENKIAYIYLDDYDLDVVESFPSLLYKECAWEYVLEHSTGESSDDSLPQSPSLINSFHISTP
ncbi:MAG: hypothetical protein IJJ15_09355 [Ruminococcus sp.]|nr:hypothetical protein [Ruminococcus sp.]